MLGRNDPALVSHHLSHWLGPNWGVGGLEVNAGLYPKVQQPEAVLHFLHPVLLKGSLRNTSMVNIIHRLHHTGPLLHTGSNSSSSTVPIVLSSWGTTQKKEGSRTDSSLISGIHPLSPVLAIQNFPHPQPSLSLPLLLVEAKPSSLRSIHFLPAPGFLYVPSHSYSWVTELDNLSSCCVKASLLLIRVDYS